MRLISSALPHRRPQTCRFAQLAHLSPSAPDQAVWKRRRIQCSLRYSTGSKNGGGQDTPHAVENDQWITAPRVDATISTQYRPVHTERSPTAQQSMTGDARIRKVQIRPGPTLGLSVLPRPTDPKSSRWQLPVDVLESESDIGHSRDIGSKLVDDSKFARDLDLWKELLLYRQRHYGDGGIIAIWKGMRERCLGVDIPVVGDDALLFWRHFVTVGLKRESFLKELMEYAQDEWSQRKRRWRGLYEAVVGGYLEIGSMNKALKWHWVLKDTHLCSPNDISRILGQAMSSKNGLKAFKTICKSVEGHKIYGSVVPRLWQRHMIQEAITMHHLLVQRNDGPRTIDEAEPLFLHIRASGSKKIELDFLRRMIESGTANKEHWMKLLRYSTAKAHDGIENKPEVEQQADNREGPSLSGGTAQTKFTDDFGARLFATKAFAFELIAGGMEMFSVRAIGPLTLRQMALRANTASGVADQIAELARRGISVADCAYSKVVRQIVARDDDITLRDLLHSDQHPDVMENQDTLELLLSSYTLSQDWRRANMVFTILSLLSDEDPYNLNVQFRNAVETGRWPATAEIIEQIKERKIPLSVRSLDTMTRMTLPRRRAGHQPSYNKAWFSSLWNLLGTFQYVANCGGLVPPPMWKEGLTRLGMAGRWDQLEPLCFWLVQTYSSPKTWHLDPFRAAETSIPSENRWHEPASAQKRAALGTIFTKSFQQGIITWGFSLLPRKIHTQRPFFNPWADNRETLIPWVRGIALLRQLKEKGVVVHEAAVQKACRQRLAVLFGRPRRSNRLRNRALRRDNPYTLEEVLANVDKAWGVPLFSNFNGTRYELVNPPTRKPPSRLRAAPLE